MMIPTEQLARKLKAIGYKPGKPPFPGFYVNGLYKTIHSYIGFPKDPVFAPYFYEIWSWLSNNKGIKIEIFYDKTSKKWIAQVETTKRFLQKEGDTQEEALIEMSSTIINSLYDKQLKKNKVKTPSH